MRFNVQFLNHLYCKSVSHNDSTSPLNMPLIYTCKSDTELSHTHIKHGVSSMQKVGDNYVFVTYEFESKFY